LDNNIKYKIKIPYDSSINLINYYRKEGYGDVYSIKVMLPSHEKVEFTIKFVVDEECGFIDKIYEMINIICNDDD